MVYYQLAQILDHPARPVGEFYGACFQVIPGDRQQMRDYRGIYASSQSVRTQFPADPFLSACQAVLGEHYVLIAITDGLARDSWRRILFSRF